MYEGANSVQSESKLGLHEHVALLNILKWNPQDKWFW